MFETTIKKLVFFVAASAFALTPILAGGHGGGGHGVGGGHMGGGGSFGGGGHVSGGGSHFSGGHTSAAPSSGFRTGSSGAGISHGGASGASRAPSIGSAPSSGHSAGHSSGPAADSSNAGRPAIGGAGIGGLPMGGNSGFTQRHFSEATSPSSPNVIHSAGHHSAGTSTSINHSVSRPSSSTSTSASAGVRHGVGDFGNTGHSVSGFHHSNNNNWHNHPARQTSFFLGVGSPFGSYWGYPGYWNWPYYYSSYWSPWYCYGSYGSFGNGYASPGFGYQSVCSYNNAYSLPVTGVTTYSSGVAVPLAAQAVIDPNAQLPAPLAADQDTAALGDDFATLGEREFNAGRYDAAARNWRHALVDEPGNGGVMLLLAQALFATSKYDEAAGAVQLGMQMLPVEKWGTVVENYRELYPKIGDYTTQLRALEKARDQKADNPALRFLLGYHYGFLGYPKNALQQLDKCVELAPKDEISQKLQQRMKELLAQKAPASVPAPATPDKPAEKAPTTPPATAEKTTP